MSTPAGKPNINPDDEMLRKIVAWRAMLAEANAERLRLSQEVLDRDDPELTYFHIIAQTQIELVDMIYRLGRMIQDDMSFLSETVFSGRRLEGE